MITSTSNTQVKNVIQLLQTSKARKKQGLFVVEGWKMCEEMPEAWLQAVYVTESCLENMPEQARKGYLQKDILHVVTDQVFRHMSDTKTPQGILAVGRQPVYTLEQVLSGSCPLIVALEDLQDPGNVGTILRTAEGAGVDGILLSRQSADVFNPKTVRSTMGAVYRMPFCYVEDLTETVRGMKGEGYRVYAAQMDGGQFYDDKDYTGKSVILIGNEGNGLTDGIRAAADEAVCIPMEGHAESLNAGVAAGILMYEAARQRRKNFG